MNAISSIDPTVFVAQALDHSVKVEATAVVIMQRENCGRRFEGERLLCDDSRVNCATPFLCVCRAQAREIIARQEGRAP